MIKIIETGFKEFWYTHMQVHFFSIIMDFFLACFTITALLYYDKFKKGNEIWRGSNRYVK